MGASVGQFTRFSLGFLVAGTFGACTSGDVSPPSPDCGPSDASPNDGSGGPIINDAGVTDASHQDPDGTPDSSDTPDSSGGPTYTNPVFALNFPDPFVLREGGRYYAFAT